MVIVNLVSITMVDLWLLLTSYASKLETQW